jgi:hypothetical protein
VARAILAVAREARDKLWGARGGLQMLSPDQAAQFTAAVRELDRLVAALRP